MTVIYSEYGTKKALSPCNNYIPTMVQNRDEQTVKFCDPDPVLVF